MVVLQFSCSIALIVSTIVVYRQIRHAKDRPSGYDQRRLVMTEMSADLGPQYEAIRNEMLQSRLVESVAGTSGAITDLNSHAAVSEWPGKSAGEEIVSIGAIEASKSYFSTLGMSLLSGKEFEGVYAKDSGTVILNETAVKRMGLKQPLGQVITWNGGGKATIVGVARDAVMESPFTPVIPVLFYPGQWQSVLLYRLSAGVNTQDALVKLRTIFTKYNPAYPYVYRFVDDEYARKFDLETLIGQLAGVFAGLAIFISCLGLFGLAAYMAEQRGKEIGIRKVLGASVGQLWLLLSRDFLLLVGISCVIASPVAWYFLNHWLQGYVYRITIGPWVFIIAGVIALMITLVTVSFQAIKAALSNPVKSLRSE